jgi:spore coat protein CotH
MKVKLHIQKAGTALYEGTYDVSDADSFGRACADVWNQLRERRLAMASIGALFDELDEQLLDELYGSNISLSKL